MASTRTRVPPGRAGACIYEPNEMLVYPDSFRPDAEIKWARFEDQQCVHQEAVMMFDHVGKDHPMYKNVAALLAILKPRERPETFERASHHMGSWMEAANFVAHMNARKTDKHLEDFRANSDTIQSSYTALKTASNVTVPDDGRVPVLTHKIYQSLTTVVLEQEHKRRLPRIKMKPLPVQIWQTPQEKESEERRLVTREALSQHFHNFAELAHWDKLVTIIIVLENWLFHRDAQHVLGQDDLPMVEQLMALHDTLIADREPSLSLEDRDLCMTVEESFGKVSRTDKLSVLTAMIEIWIETEESNITPGIDNLLLDFIIAVEKCPLALPTVLYLARH